MRSFILSIIFIMPLFLPTSLRADPRPERIVSTAQYCQGVLDRYHRKVPGYSPERQARLRELLEELAEIEARNTKMTADYRRTLEEIPDALEWVLRQRRDTNHSHAYRGYLTEREWYYKMLAKRLTVKHLERSRLLEDRKAGINRAIAEITGDPKAIEQVRLNRQYGEMMSDALPEKD